MEELNNKIAISTKWSSLAEIAAKFILPIVNMILARLLTPEAFGIVATITIVITFAEVFQDAGFQKFIIQHEFKTDIEFNRYANVAFWSNFIISMLVYVCIICFRRSISELIGATNLELEIVVAGVSIPIFALCSIQVAYFKRNFEFKKLFWVRIITSMVPLIVTVPLAIILRNHWALILGTICRNVVQAIVLYNGAMWKPKFDFSFTILGKMISFCIWTLIESITIWCSSNISVFIVTRILGVEVVGLYKTSMATVTSITSIVTAATTSVLFSALSRTQNNDSEFYRVFYGYQMIVSIVVLPLGMGIFLYRDLCTRILLGRQWMECSDFIGIYAIAMALTIVTSYFFSELYRAKGKPRVSTVVQIIYIIILIPSIYCAARFGFDTLCFTAVGLLGVFVIIHFVVSKIITTFALAIQK